VRTQFTPPAVPPAAIAPYDVVMYLAIEAGGVLSLYIRK
jgi:hypothetical protein